MRQLTLEEEEEEEEEEVQRRCEEKSPSAAMEDPGPGGLHADPTDSKTLQGTALGVEVLLSRRRRLTCAAADQASGGEGDGLGFGREVPSALVSPQSLSHEPRFPGSPWAQLHSSPGFLWP